MVEEEKNQLHWNENQLAINSDQPRGGEFWGIGLLKNRSMLCRVRTARNTESSVGRHRADILGTTRRRRFLAAGAAAARQAWFNTARGSHSLPEKRIPSIVIRWIYRRHVDARARRYVDRYYLSKEVPASSSSSSSSSSLPFALPLLLFLE